MTRAPIAWVSILGLNLAWILILPSRSGRMVALAGAGVAALALLVPYLTARGRDYLAEVTREPPPAGAAALAGPFLLPALSLVAVPRLAFWNLDGRSWLILAWLTAAIVLSRAPAQAARAVRPATLLFILWTAAFWFALVSDLGVAGFVLANDRTAYLSCQSDPLSAIFRIWETQPARDHLFLGWRTLESFQQGQPYANHVHPYLFTMYAWTRLVRAATGAALYVADNSTPFFYMFVLIAAVTALLARLGLLRQRSTAVSLLTLFIGYGFVVTGWRFWNDLYRFNTDNPFPLLAGVFILVYAFLIEPIRPAAAAVSAAVFVALSPTHAPMAAVAVLFLFGTSAPSGREFLRRNRVPLLVTACAVAAGVIAYAAPWMLIKWKGYSPVSSTFLFRSGLDGDTQYFSNMAQSIIAPCPRACCWGRTFTDLVYPAFVPLVIFGALAARWSGGSQVRLGHVLLFLCTPYLISAVLFPQSLSIHPYMYDHILLIPVTVTGTLAMLTPGFEARLRGTWLLGFLLLCGGLLMANLVGIAQGLAAMPPRP